MGATGILAVAVDRVVGHAPGIGFVVAAGQAPAPQRCDQRFGKAAVLIPQDSHRPGALAAAVLEAGGEAVDRDQGRLLAAIGFQPFQLMSDGPLIGVIPGLGAGLGLGGGQGLVGRDRGSVAAGADRGGMARGAVAVDH